MDEPAWGQVVTGPTWEQVKTTAIGATDYDRKFFDFLQNPIPVDSPEQIMEAASEAEAKNWFTITRMSCVNEAINDVNRWRAGKRALSLSEYSKEKVAVAEAKTAADLAEVDWTLSILNAELTYLKQMSDTIARRCSLCQSYLSNMTAMVKSGVK